MMCMLMHLFGYRHTATDPRNGEGVVRPNRDNPRDILDRRFASGEITREQYQELKLILNTLGDNT